MFFTVKDFLFLLILEFHQNVHHDISFANVVSASL